jgi:hypothetical protein
MGVNKDIYQSSRHFYFILKSLGLAFYRFDAKSMHLKTDSLSYFMCALTLFITIALTFFQIKWFKANDVSVGLGMNILDKLWVNQYYVQQLIAIFIIAFNFAQRKRIESFLNSLYKFDRFVGQMKWKFSSQKDYHRIISTLFILSSFSFSSYAIIENYVFDAYGLLKDTWKTFISIVVFILLFNLYFVLSLQFILSAICVKLRLETMMENICFLIPSSTSDIIEHVRMHPTRERLYIKHIGIMYDILADAVDDINSVFSIEVNIFSY